jgi:3-dehydroquinate dehydratase-2
MNILILNGPNLNMLEERPADMYGGQSLGSIEALIRESYPDHQFRFIQSNHEGELVEALHMAHKDELDGVVANFAAYTHTSIALHDAIEMLDLPVIEVHLSNIHAREEFREHSMTGAAAAGVITGFGAHSYVLGVQALSHHIENQKG